MLRNDYVRLIHELRRRRIRTALVSNADSMEVAGYALSPLTGLFDVEVFSWQVRMVKPEPAIYLHALRKSSLEAPACVFVGNGGSNELEDARAVGLQTIFVSVDVEDLWPDRLEERASVGASPDSPTSGDAGAAFVARDS